MTIAVILAMTGPQIWLLQIIKQPMLVLKSMAAIAHLKTRTLAISRDVTLFPPSISRSTSS